MTRYERNRVRIWMIQVRNKRPKEKWSVTGVHWFHTRKEALDYISTIFWRDLEYRAVPYMPETWKD